MGHGHHHHGESVSAYFTEQLLTILVCGLFGFVAIQLYRTGMLEQILAKQFRPWVLGGGIAILVLVVIRSLAVWREAGEFQAQSQSDYGPSCGIDHIHDVDCDHDPGIGASGDAAQAHSHDHSHDMSWVFARMLVLVFPIALFFLGLPSGSFSQAAQAKMLGKEEALGADQLDALMKGAGAGGAGSEMGFNELNDAAFDEAKRQSLEGKTAILEGRFKRLADKEFTLFRLKMTCCAADTVPLKVRIIVPQSPNNIKDFDWVRVKGQIQFIALPGGKAGAENYIPVLLVADITDVRKAEPKNEYE